jgi:hypothetical protein
MHLLGCFWRLLIDLVDCHVPIDALPPPGVGYSLRCGCAGQDEGGECMPWNWLHKFDPILAADGRRYGSKYLV